MFSNLFKKNAPIEHTESNNKNIIEEMYNQKINKEANEDEEQKTQIINTEEIRNHIKDEEKNIEEASEKNVSSTVNR